MKKPSAFLRLDRKNSQAARVLAGSIAALLAATSAHAAIWNGAGPSWSDTANWDTGVVPIGGDTATFNATGVANPAIDTTGGVAIKTILFDTGAAAYTIGNQGAIQLDPGGNITMAADVAANQVIDAAVNVASTGVTISNASTTNPLTINGNINFAIHSMTLNKTGAGQVVLTGTNWLNPDSKGKFGKLTLTGGGKLTISGSTYLATNAGNTTGVSYDGNVYVGKDASGNGSGSNILDVSGTGRLWSTGLNLGGYGGATYPNTYGSNTVNLSAPGTTSSPTFYDYMQGGEAPSTTCIGNNTDSNVVAVTNGACFRFANLGSAMQVGCSTQATGGAQYNGITIDGYNGSNPSRFYSSGSRWIQVGGGPTTNAGATITGNYMAATNGGSIFAARFAVGQQGTGNYVTADGSSGSFRSTVEVGMWTVGGNAASAGGTGNGSGNANECYIKISNGANFTSTSGDNVANFIGCSGTSSHNYIQVDGVNSTLTNRHNNAPLTIGGSFKNAVNTDYVNATGNFLAITNGGYGYVNSVYLNGTGSKVILGATSIPTYVAGVLTPTTTSTANLAQLEVRPDSNTLTPIQGIYLAKADARLEINNGRLIAGANGILVAPGAMVSGVAGSKIDLQGPAYFSTAFSPVSPATTASMITCEITGPGSLTKEGTGMLTLAAGMNNYEGDTNVVAGKLELNSANPNNDSSAVSVDSNNSQLILNYEGTDTVGSLVINGNPMPDGTYGVSSVLEGIPSNPFIGTGTITVGAPVMTYARWASSKGIAGQPANGDYDNDGVSNGVEMVVGGDPKNVMDAGLLPTLALVTNPDQVTVGSYLEFTYRRTKTSVDAGVTAVCEYGSDLVSPWTPVVTPYPDGVQVIETLNHYDTGIDRVQVYVPRATNTELFGRLSVTVP